MYEYISFGTAYRVIYLIIYIPFPQYIIHSLIRTCPDRPLMITTIIIIITTRVFGGDGGGGGGGEGSSARAKG